MSSIKKVFFIILLLVFANSLSAQQYYFKNYTSEDGLAQLTCQAIFQDRDGYIWVGTQAGLNRYDGNRFELYSVGDGLKNDWINAITQDKDGHIWIATNSGLSKLTEKGFQNYTEADGLPDRYVRTLAIDSENRVWCGTRNGLVYWNGNSFVPINPQTGIPVTQVNFIYNDNNDQLWVATNSGLFYQKNGHFAKFEHVQIDSLKITAVTRDLSHNLWVGTTKGLFSFNGKELLAKYNNGIGIDDFRINVLLTDQAGIIWAGTLQGLVKVEHGNVNVILQENGLPFSGARSIIQDREGILWVGSFGGMAKFFGRPFVNYTKEDGLSDNVARPIVSDKTGNVWVGTQKGLDVFNGKKWFNYKKENGLPSNFIEALVIDSEHKIWVGTSTGLAYSEILNFQLSDSVFFKQVEQLKGYGRVVYIVEDKVKTKWLSIRDKGVFTLTGNILEKVEVRNQSFTNARMVVDHHGNVWISGDDGLSCWNGQNWKTFTMEHGLADNEPYFLAEDNTGDLWFGYHSSRGITSFDGTSFKTYTTKDGLFNDAVYSIGVDKENNIWIGTSRGVDRFNGCEFVNYGRSDGYVNEESNAGGFCLAKDGSLWFGTSGGVSHYIPEKDFNLLEINSGFQISEVVIGSQRVNPDSIIQLNRNHGNINIRISPLTYINAKHLEYRYRLIDYDETWRELKSFEIEYSHLPPGDYQLEIQRRKYKRTWSSIASCTFKVNAPFWFTWWFILLALCFVISAIILWTHYRTKKLRNEQIKLEELVRERTFELSKEKEKAESFMMLVENSPDFIGIATLDGNAIFVNNCGRKLVGLKHDEDISHRPITDFHPQQAADVLLKEILPMAMKGGHWAGNFQLRNFQTGAVIETYGSLFSIKHHETNEPIYYATVQKDISDINAAQEEVIRERNLLQAFMNNIPEYLYFKDKDAKYLKINKSMATAFGFKEPKEAIGKTDFDMFSDEYALAADKDDLQVLQKGKNVINKIEKEIRKDKSGNWVSTTKVPLRDGKNEIIGLIGITRDVTKHIKNQEELKKAKLAAESASQSKSNFLANMSHEIRTPLNAIIGMTDLTLESELNSEQRENLLVVQRSSESLLSLINDILDFSKIEAGQMELEIIDFQINEIMEWLLDVFAVKAEEKNIELIGYIEPKLPDIMKGDVTRLRQILINLIGNAIKFTENGNVCIKVEKSKKRGEIVFSVSDTGIGISKQQQKKIFEKFTQADNSTTRKFGGTGLGLSITKSLVELMGGKLWVQSELHVGTTFCFSLNLGKGKSGTRDLKHNKQHNKFTILVIDDTPDSLMMLSKSLLGYGFKTETAESIENAKALFDKIGKKFDLVIIDSSMPGFEQINEFNMMIQKMNLKDMKFILLSDFENKKDKKPQIDSNLVLSKPIKQSGFVNAVLQVLGLETKKLSNNVSLKAQEKSYHRNKKHKILVVEDNPDNQRLANSILNNVGYNVEIANDGKMAVDIVKKDHFDLILMDIQMPVQDGFTATREIRVLEETENIARIPIVALTAHAIEGYREKCLKFGMDDYITKPIKKKALLDTVDKWLSNCQTILIVDDSVDNRTILKKHLRNVKNCNFIFAENGKEALEHVSGKKVFSLVLIDMEMPVMSGYESVKKMRELLPDKQLPIIGMSAHHGQQAEIKCLEAGCTKYLEKPIRKKQLFESLGNYIELEINKKVSN